MCKVIIRFIPCRNNRAIGHIASDRRTAALNAEMANACDGAYYGIRRVAVKVKCGNPQSVDLLRNSWRFDDRRLVG